MGVQNSSVLIICPSSKPDYDKICLSKEITLSLIQSALRSRAARWNLLVKVFTVAKVADCRPLTLLKLTLSQTAFKNLAKITTLCLREWLINVQLRSVLLVVPVMKRNKLQNLIFL